MAKTGLSKTKEKQLYAATITRYNGDGGVTHIISAFGYEPQELISGNKQMKKLRPNLVLKSMKSCFVKDENKKGIYFGFFIQKMISHPAKPKKA